MGLVVLAACATVGCNALAGTSGANGNGGGIIYDPDPYQQLEDNLDMWEEVKADFLQDPESFIDEHSGQWRILAYLTPEKILAEINKELAETRRLKESLAAESGDD